MKTVDERLRRLLTIPGTSGFEEDVRDYIKDQLPEGLTVDTDAMGNLIASVGRGEPTVLFAAHMDEIGFLTTGITEDGFVRFQKIGTIDDTILPGTTVTIIGREGPVHGVIGVRPPHLGGAESMTADSVVIDVGVDSARRVADLGIEPTQQAVFAREPRLLGDHLVNCRTLDDRFGCYVLLRACEYAVENPKNGRFLFVWSTQEEVGLRGAKALARTLDFDVAFPVDAYATGNSPREPSRYVYARQGGGPVLRMFDHGSIASRTLGSWLETLAARHDLPLQAGATGGSTDGVPLQETGVHMVPLAVAMRNLHSLAETADYRDIETLVSLIERIIDSAQELLPFQRDRHQHRN